jgi:hypothetical protein
MVRLFTWLGARRSAEYEQFNKSVLSENDIEELEAISREAFDSDVTSREFVKNASSASVPAALLSIFNPDPFVRSSVILPYRRPALKFVPEHMKHTLARTPILVTSNFQMGGYASVLSSGLPYIEIPYGLIIYLGVLSRVIIGIVEHLDDVSKIELEAYKRCYIGIARSLFSPALSVWIVINQSLGNPIGKAKLQLAHGAHVMGVFVLLHEYGHVALNHISNQLDASADIESGEEWRNEFAADWFAAKSLLRWKDDRQRHWDDVRELHLFLICALLLTFDKVFEANGQEIPKSHPSGRERCKALLETSGAPERVRRTLARFQGIVT